MLGAALGVGLLSVLLALRGVPVPGWASGWLPMLISLLSAACFWWAAERAPRAHRPAWRLCALGVTAWWLGDVVFLLYKQLAPSGETPFPSWADVLYLLFAPLMTLGLYRLLRPDAGPARARLLLDISTAVITVFVVLWHFVYAQTLVAAERSLAGLLVNLSYPIQDSLMVSLVLLVVFQERRPLPQAALRWLGVGLLANFVADVAYAALLPEAWSVTNQIIDGVFALGLIGLGVAAVLSVGWPGEGERRAPLSPQSIALSPYLAILICFTLFAWPGRALTLRDFGVLVGTALVTLVVVWRQNLTLRENLQLTAELERRATHDPLTGLPNRRLLETRLEEALARARHTGEHVALLFLDLDRFKAINDRLGHAAGDELLIAVADVLRRALRPKDTLARQGGDEFIVVLPGLSGPEEAERLTEHLLEQLRTPVYVGGRPLVVTGSVGLAVFPRDGTDSTTLQQHGDAAMYAVKARGRNGQARFRPEMTLALAALDLEQELRRALNAGDFQLHYQPQVHAVQGVVGAEALLRWRRGDELVLPGRFIPVAEETGLIVPIGAWVLHEACRQLAAWRAAGLVLARVAVNVSARQLAEPDFLDVVRSALTAANLKPSDLDLELTESAVLHDVPGAAQRLTLLRGMEIRVAVDDFGADQSSLGLLRHVPADVLKIDRSWVASLGASEESSALVRVVVVFAHTLGLEVVAKGVETESQWAALRHLDCVTAQGDAFLPPRPAAEFASWLRRQQPVSR